MATLYFYGLNDGNLRSWQTASYWKTSDSPSGVASATLPAIGDDVVIRRPLTSPPSGLNLNSITINIPSGYSPGANSLVFVNLLGCKNLTTTSGIYIKYNNQLGDANSSDGFPGQMVSFVDQYSNSSNLVAATGLPITTINSKIVIDMGGAYVTNNGNYSVISLNNCYRRYPWALKINGDVSVTGVLASGSAIPWFRGFSFPSGNIHLENVRTWGFFSDISRSTDLKTASAGTEYLTNSNTNYNIYCSGCVLDERKFRLTNYDINQPPPANLNGTVWYEADVSGISPLKAKNATFINCSQYTAAAGNSIAFGPQLESLIITNSTMGGTEAISISGSPNITLTNSTANFKHKIPSTGNITCVNSTITHIDFNHYYGNIDYRTNLRGSGSYIYLDGTSKFQPYSDYYGTITSLVPVSGYTVVSQYPNRYPVLASGNYALTYSGYPSARTLYFNNAVDDNILTSGNWWNDSAYTSAASEPGLPSDDVVISGSITVNNVGTLNYNSLTLYDSSISAVSTGIIYSNTNIVLNGSSNIILPQMVRVNSGIVINDTSYINGNNLGNFGIYGSGSIVFNDNSKYIGDTSKIYLNITWNGFDGWDENDSIYYMGGRSTSLDSSGTGWDAYSNTYYLNAVATTLDSSGNGFWNNHAYYNGSLQPTGWNGYYYYLDDVQTTLDQYAYGSWNGLFYNGYPTLLTGYDWWYSGGYYIEGILTSLDYDGSGFWEGHAYYWGGLQPTGYNGYYYYIDDVQTDLDSNGSGFWNGHAYYYGSLQPTGWNDYGYYINDVLTDLDSNGTGTWDGYYWYNGIRQVVGTIFIGTDGDWDNLSNWIDINNYPATELPNSSSDVSVTTSITTIATQNPTVNSLVVENTATISIDITVTTSSTFNDSSSYSGAYHLYSDTVVFNNSSSAGGNIHPTTSITFNNNSSASGLALDSARVYIEAGYLNISGFPIDPASLNITNDTANTISSITFSRAGLGVNGSNILGLI